MKISGKIVDSNNEPLQLANVTIITGALKDKMGAVANEKGDFELENEIIDADSKFKISYQGFKSQEYKASELQNKKIKLLEEATILQDVVFNNTKPTSNKTKTTINNVKENFNQHKIIYAGLGGIVGLALILMNLKKK
jgi:sensor c-di-GMP phosphodiesterase-like protein